jgi:hypothetical protein
MNTMELMAHGKGITFCPSPFMKFDPSYSFHRLMHAPGMEGIATLNHVFKPREKQMVT